jgi:hypothetical protein
VRLKWENGWSILFREATVTQSRNDHSLMKEFEDEIPGYLHNRSICEALKSLELSPGIEHIPSSMRRCYEVIVKNNWVGEKEMMLLDAWLEDIAAMKCQEDLAI